MKIKTITDAIEEFAPKTLAEPWDNPGLMMGSLSNECTGVVCALDLTFEVVDEALANGCNLIVTHHPFFFSAIKSIDTDESKGLLIKKVLENGLTVYSAHTNLDECDGGLCQSLAKTLGGENLCPNGVGVVCYIKETTLGQFARHVASVLGDDSVKFAGDANKKIAKMLCICGGGAADSAYECAKQVADVFVTGDFKIDFTPIDNKLTDLERIGEIGKKGVLLMLGESTNVERNGHTMSERTVGESFDVIFGKNQKKRMIVATFSTNNYRLQQLMDISVKYNRKVVLSGRSMKNIVDMAAKLNELTFPKDLIVDIDKANKLPPERVTILCTGSQGEPMSALSRMSQGTFDKVTISATDTVVISATPIPGNERGVYNVVNNLYKLGADVIYNPSDDIHVSGHACKEELKLMLSLVRPKFFIPVHGEYRHLKLHQRLAGSMGIPEYNTFIPDVGNTVNVYKNKMVKGNNVPAGNNFIDGVALGENAETILRDRKALSDNGFIVILLTVRLKSGEILAGPDIILRGLHLGDTFPDEAKEVVLNALKQVDFENVEDIYELKTIIRKAIRKFIDKNYKQLPMILPIIIEA